MSESLSPQIEAKIAEALSLGLYSSRAALLEAGVELLLEENIPMIPEEHAALVEEAIESANAGECSEMTRAEWDELRQMVADIAAGKKVVL